MSRPHLVRADTLDLQSRDRASAQDHSIAPSNSRNGSGFAPSQSQAIRKVSAGQAQAKIELEKQSSAPKEVDVDEVDQDLAGTEELAADEGGFDDDDDMGDRMSSSPSIADEDIDFEMVYALHTFNATVEGQANATKGEHMVLLDDSNSYWWLVRIVRDASIGYLPAEHIETPTERLARLNKHRNIDLASNMLSDNSHEKSKNPLRKAMRRRNAKTVTFTAPTYVEASEYEYSTDEEDGENSYYANEEDEGAQADTERNSTDTERGESGAGKSGTPEGRVRSSSDSGGSDPARGDDDVKIRKNPAPASLRHPDSAVFNDDQQETKKLTLTPNLLRDDNTSIGAQVDHVRGRSSIEKLKREDGIISPQPGGKDSRKPKKGGSVLGNLFKKRSKRGRKEEEDEVDEWLHGGEKQAASISSRESQESQTDDAKREKEEAQKREDQRRQQLQQQQRDREPGRVRGQEREPQQKPNGTVAPLTIRRVESDSEIKEQAQVHGPSHQKQAVGVQKNDPGSKPTAAVHAPSERKRSTSSERRNGEVGAVSQKKLAALHSPVELGPAELARKPSKENVKPAYAPNIYRPASQTTGDSNGTEARESSNESRQFQDRLSESPEHISYHDAISDRPDMLDLSSGSEDTSLSPAHSSPEIIDRANTLESSSPESHPMTRTWSDWSLRTYFEDDNDVRDMLIVVQQDKSNSVAAKQEHPDIDPLFEDASTKLADITKRLDGMLGDWLQRKGRTRS